MLPEGIKALVTLLKQAKSGIAHCLLACSVVLVSACSGGGSASDEPDTLVQIDTQEGGRATMRVTESAGERRVDIEILPDAGYAIESVTGCSGRLSDTTYIIENVEEECAVAIRFRPVSVLAPTNASDMDGEWLGFTRHARGDHQHSFVFDATTAIVLPESGDLALAGQSYLGQPGASVPGVSNLVRFDSGRGDWYILEYWNADGGTASLFELQQSDTGVFQGCEYFIDLPLLRFQDGICHPVSLERANVELSYFENLARAISRFFTIIREFISEDPAVDMVREGSIYAEREELGAMLGSLLSAPATAERLMIASPADSVAVSQNVISLSGSSLYPENVLAVTLNDVPLTREGNRVTGNVALDDGVNVLNVQLRTVRGDWSFVRTVTLDRENPMLISAASTSSSTVVVQFSERMRTDLADDTVNFSITRNDNGLDLPITGIEFVSDEQKAIRLTTGLQTNETYTVRAVNAYDAAGNAISGPLPEVNISVSEAVFVGTRPGGDAIIDSDNDGLPDHVELSGWLVTVTRTGGLTETIYVSSDPFNVDTDNDGVPDAEERHGGLDPRNADTDGDTLSDDDEWNRIYSDGTNQDSDGDGIQDGFEYLFFGTSPILADTDGDQIDDPTEVAAGNRNPLIADLPSPSITIGNVNLQLDTRYTFTDETGAVVTENRTVESTLSQGQNETFSSANESSTKNTVNNSLEISATVSKEVEADVKPKASIGFSLTTTARTERGSEKGYTLSFGEESSRSAEEAYHDSLSTESARDTRESISREIIGASMRVDVSIDNAGELPFSISNLEVSAQTQDPADRRRIIPVASLLPENESLDTVNIGALGDPSRGPFVFRTDSIFPSEMEELMKNPRGIIFQLANFDIVDQNGNNFAFTSQDVLDRTAGITFDLGDGRAESYRVATASDHHPVSGVPNGISMAKALSIIGLEGSATIRDGGNGVVETAIAVGSDDESTFSVGESTEPRAILVRAGSDSMLSTVPGGDDYIAAADYATKRFSESSAIVDGGNGIVETVALGSDDAVAALSARVEPGQVLIRTGADNSIETVPTGDDVLLPAGTEREVLLRYKGLSASDDEFKFWVLFTGNNVDGVDLGDIRVRAGEQYDFAFVQDKDGDGVWAREEYLHGSSDTEMNTDGCDLTPTDCDTLSDFSEIHEGWLVQLKSSPQAYRVYSNPAQADSDRDGLYDDVEKACGLDPRLRDTDYDGLSDYEEVFGVRVVGNTTTTMVSTKLDDAAFTPFDITRYAGDRPDPLPDTGSALPKDFVEHDQSDACRLALASMGMIGEGYATDPLAADTDGDFVDDLAELGLGLHPSDRNDGGNFLDDDGDGLPNAAETIARTITINGTTLVSVTSNPNKADSDDDKLPDLLEYYLGSDPNNPDTDGDGIDDTDEYRNAGQVCIGNAADPCELFINKLRDDYNAFVSACNEATNCNNTEIEGTGTFGLGSEQQLGTNLNLSDTDGDGLSDLFEIRTRAITVNGALVNVTSNAFLRDTDADGLWDGDETSRGSNPNSGNTDGDARTDAQEASLGTNLSVTDKKIRVRVRNIVSNVNVLSFVSFGVAEPSAGSCNWSYSGGDINDSTAAFGGSFGDCNFTDFILRPSDGLNFSIYYDHRPNGGLQGGCVGSGGYPYNPALNLSVDFYTAAGTLRSPTCSRSGTSGGTSDHSFYLDFEISEL